MGSDARCPRIWRGTASFHRRPYWRDRRTSHEVETVKLEDLIEPILTMLNELVVRVKTRLPSASGFAKYVEDIPLQPHASFLSSASAQSLDLCVLLSQVGDRGRCEADLVQGGTGVCVGEES